jgi:RNA polymerase sigma-70 factor (ECF subfamily)
MATAVMTWMPNGAQWAAPKKLDGGRNLLEQSLDLDSSLVARCLSGDETAWEDLVRTHTRRVYGLCYRFTGSDAEAQDLTQDVFLRVYRTLKTFRSTEGSFVTWLSRLTRNLLIDHYRRTKYERVTDSLDDEEASVQPLPSKSEAADAGVWRREISEHVQRALTRLSPELREAVILRDLQDMDYKEIAAALHVPEGTVKSRINRGRIELARLLRHRL